MRAVLGSVTSQTSLIAQLQNQTLAAIPTEVSIGYTSPQCIAEKSRLFVGALGTKRFDARLHRKRQPNDLSSSGISRKMRGHSPEKQVLNPDFRDMLSALSDEQAEFLVVGAYALAAHGVPRATGDIDIWIRASPQNAGKVMRALAVFGAPLDQISEADLATPRIVFQLGVAPRRIDILTSITGVEFEAAWHNRKVVDVAGLAISVLAKQDFLANKRALGRAKDLADIEALSEADDA